MFEYHDAVDADDRNVPAVARNEVRVYVNVDFDEMISISAIGGKYFALHLFAEVAARSRVECDLRFHRGCENSDLPQFREFSI